MASTTTKPRSAPKSATGFEKPKPSKTVAASSRKRGDERSTPPQQMAALEAVSAGMRGVQGVAEMLDTLKEMTRRRGEEMDEALMTRANRLELHLLRRLAQERSAGSADIVKKLEIFGAGLDVLAGEELEALDKVFQSAIAEIGGAAGGDDTLLLGVCKEFWATKAAIDSHEARDEKSFSQEESDASWKEGEGLSVAQNEIIARLSGFRPTTAEGVREKVRCVESYWRSVGVVDPVTTMDKVLNAVWQDILGSDVAPVPHSVPADVPRNAPAGPALEWVDPATTALHLAHLQRIADQAVHARKAEKIAGLLDELSSLDQVMNKGFDNEAMDKFTGIETKLLGRLANVQFRDPSTMHRKLRIFAERYDSENGDYGAALKGLLHGTIDGLEDLTFTPRPNTSPPLPSDDMEIEALTDEVGELAHRMKDADETASVVDLAECHRHKVNRLAQMEAVSLAGLKAKADAAMTLFNPIGECSSEPKPGDENYLLYSLCVDLIAIGQDWRGVDRPCKVKAQLPELVEVWQDFDVVNRMPSKPIFSPTGATRAALAKDTASHLNARAEAMHALIATTGATSMIGAVVQVMIARYLIQGAIDFDLKEPVLQKDLEAASNLLYSACDVFTQLSEVNGVEVLRQRYVDRQANPFFVADAMLHDARKHIVAEASK